MNIEKIRNDITDCNEKLFLNSAGSSLMPKSVVKEITNYLLEEEKYGGYLVTEKQSDKVEEFYTQAAQLINAKPHNLAFTHDATDSHTKALSCIPFEVDDVIIMTNDVYNSNLIQFVSLQKWFGVQIKRIINLENGDLNISHFEELIDSKKPKLVAITHILSNSGLVQNVKDIGKICNQKQILFLLDTCQSIGQLNVDIEESNRSDVW